MFAILYIGVEIFFEKKQQQNEGVLILKSGIEAPAVNSYSCFKNISYRTCCFFIVVFVDKKKTKNNIKI